MKRYVAVAGTLLMTLVSGCFYELRDEFAEMKIGFANRSSAKAAWTQSEGACTGMSCPHSFKEGFKTGYIAVANGANGCPPAYPVIGCHNHMWMDRCSESEKMEAWYDGYEVGAMAAKGDGMGDANRITTRLPHTTPTDYSNSGHNPPTSIEDVSPSSGIPPAPNTEPGVIGGPQTLR
jgi:hypothetical protein